MLEEALREIGIEPSELMVSQLRKYYEMIIEKNKVMNLTAITDEKEFVYKHFVDSLSMMTETGLSKADEAAKATALKACSENTPCRMIDVGTGAGFPGLVLKIVYPQIDMTLFDSLKKRLTFLDEVIDELGLTGVRTLHGRAEDIGHDKLHRGVYDIVTARAVANLSTLSEYCLPLVKKGGMFVAYKSAQAGEEAESAKKAVELLGGKVTDIREFTLPGTDYQRALVYVEKVKDTPARYPRKAGTPAKEPL